MIDSDSPKVIWISGPPAAGKSTLAAELVKKFSRALIIPIDDIREWVKVGGAGPVPWTDETERQYRLGEIAACLVARHYFQSGFSVVIDACRSPIRIDELLQEQVPELKVNRFLLLPSLQENLRRAHSRIGKDFAPDFLDSIIESTHRNYPVDLPSHWHALDNTELTMNAQLKLIQEILLTDP